MEKLFTTNTILHDKTDLINIYYVYQHTIEGESNPYYIGKGKGNRLTQHFNPYPLKLLTLKNEYIKKAWSEGKYIHTEIIWGNLDEQTAYEIEALEVKLHGRINNGTGCLTNGNDGGSGNHGAEMPKRWEASHISQKQLSEVWANANNLYEFWLKYDKCGNRKLENILFKRRSDKLKNIILSFKKGWIPCEDDDWIEWVDDFKQNNDQIILKEININTRDNKWENYGANLEIWCQADILYDYWLYENKCGVGKLCNRFKLNDHILVSIITYFKDNWIPNKDEDWLKWSNDYKSKNKYEKLEYIYFQLPDKTKWKARNIKPIHLEQVWKIADIIYNKWIEIGRRHSDTLEHRFKYLKGRLSNIVDYFKQGWIPQEDQEWIETFKNK